MSIITYDFKIVKKAEELKTKVTAKRFKKNIVLGNICVPQGSVCFSSENSNTVYFTGI